jgi:hypothetical protein
LKESYIKDDDRVPPYYLAKIISLRILKWIVLRIEK